MSVAKGFAALVLGLSVLAASTPQVLGADTPGETVAATRPAAKAKVGVIRLSQELNPLMKPTNVLRLLSIGLMLLLPAPSLWSQDPGGHNAGPEASQVQREANALGLSSRVPHQTDLFTGSLKMPRNIVSGAGATMNVR